ncbi:MAG TPA: hypothetical protein VN379_21040 [Sporomusa sp.]|nr:hypothetical protein [Sporomusa sp.]
MPAPKRRWHFNASGPSLFLFIGAAVAAVPGGFRRFLIAHRRVSLRNVS